MAIVILMAVWGLLGFSLGARIGRPLLGMMLCGTTAIVGVAVIVTMGVRKERRERALAQMRSERELITTS
jgi:hypothetical protein